MYKSIGKTEYFWMPGQIKLLDRVVKVKEYLSRADIEREGEEPKWVKELREVIEGK